MEFKVCCLRLTGSTAEVVLIESDWNLKQSSTDLGLTLGAVLIESDWNLKKIMFSISQVSVAVLIESDWNLKLNPSTIEKLPTVVLIESDWNLKEIIQRWYYNCFLSINRIRLEFKDCKQTKIMNGEHEY